MYLVYFESIENNTRKKELLLTLFILIFKKHAVLSLNIYYRNYNLNNIQKSKNSKIVVQQRECV